MKIGLIDVDGHNFPNIPLMKISAWHKSQGDSVEWYYPLLSGHMDKVYMSKVFSFTPDYEYYIDADYVARGGAAIASKMLMAKRYTMRPKIMTFLMKQSISIPIIPFTELQIRHTDI